MILNNTRAVRLYRISSCYREYSSIRSLAFAILQMFFGQYIQVICGWAALQNTTRLCEQTIKPTQNYVLMVLY